MPLDLKKAQQSLHKTIALLPVGSEDGQVSIEEVDIWFRPITPALLAKLQDENSSQEGEPSAVEAVARWLSKVIIKWSITSDGKPIEPSFKILSTLDRYQIEALADAINGHVYPKKAT